MSVPSFLNTQEHGRELDLMATLLIGALVSVTLFNT